MSKEKRNIELKRKRKRLITWTILGVVVAYVIFAVLPFWVTGMAGEFLPNTLGDSFGMANAFFSAMALAFIIITLNLQMDEMELQREVMKEQREEMVVMQRVQLLAVKMTNLMKMNKPRSNHVENEISALEGFIDRHVKKYVSENDLAGKEEIKAQISCDCGECSTALTAIIESHSQPPLSISGKWKRRSETFDGHKENSMKCLGKLIYNTNNFQESKNINEDYVRDLKTISMIASTINFSLMDEEKGKQLRVTQEVVDIFGLLPFQSGTSLRELLDQICEIFLNPRSKH